jgi:glyoxylase-like metal-dependent hydrolase (beta-lactamase superfamily II)
LKKNNKKTKTSFSIKGFVNAKIKARGPLLYYLRDFDSFYDIYSIYWKVKYNGKIFLVDTGIKDIDYINMSTKGGQKWERTDDIKKFEKIDYIFPTHLHYDHCSGIFDYNEAKIIITNKTYKNLFEEKYNFLYKENIYNDKILKEVKECKSERFRIVDDGEEILEGVSAHWVGGHTPCSQSILFECDSNYKDMDFNGFLFAGDIIFTNRNIVEKIPGGLFYNLLDFYSFYDKFNESGLMIIPGHDGGMVERINNL